ncbi:hypothetical protein QWJ26_29230 [Streptomyces sp. CSDS2]|nr:hypothetical protein [Streptomyces sp. CSDS2]MDN3263819.1 hypothetical protein [Streptomyces sp. CSDS2]
MPWLSARCRAVGVSPLPRALFLAAVEREPCRTDHGRDATS